MLALQEKGIDKVAVIIDALNDNRRHTKPIDFMPLTGQSFAEHRKGTNMYYMICSLCRNDMPIQRENCLQTSQKAEYNFLWEKNL
jgi:hypothetical protein